MAVSRSRQGNRAIRINPTVDYPINSRLRLQLRYEYTQNKPKTFNGPPETTTNVGGVNVIFTLNIVLQRGSSDIRFPAAADHSSLRSGYDTGVEFTSTQYGLYAVRPLFRFGGHRFGFTGAGNALNFLALSFCLPGNRAVLSCFRMPVSSGFQEGLAAFDLRWKVMANRWASFLACWMTFRRFAVSC